MTSGHSRTLRSLLSYSLLGIVTAGDARLVGATEPVYVFSTYAGVPKSSTTGSAVSTVQLNKPAAIATDPSGNVFVADTLSHVIRKLSPGGSMTIVAGAEGTPGDQDGRGTSARFDGPTGIAVNPTGTLYVADTGNHLVRKITPDGQVSTIGGTRSYRGSADGATITTFDSPQGIVVDGEGNVYVAEGGDNHDIRKISPSGVVSTLAGLHPYSGNTSGTGSAARFEWPRGITIGPDNNLYLVDRNTGTIRKVTAAGVATNYAGVPYQPGWADGSAASAQFRKPEGIAVDRSGTVYVADTGNHVVRKISTAGLVSTLAGSVGVAGATDGSGTVARFNQPVSLAFDASENLLVAERENSAIRRVSTAGTVTTVFGHPSTLSVFSAPTGVALTATGQLIVADAEAHAVFSVAPDGTVTTLAGSSGMPGNVDGSGSQARFNGPEGVAVDPVGDIYVADRYNGVLRRITSDRTTSTPALTGRSYPLLTDVSGLVSSDNGTLYATSLGALNRISGGRVLKLSPDGFSETSTDFSVYFAEPRGVTLDATGNIYVATDGAHAIYKVSPAGVKTTLAGTPGISGYADGTRTDAKFSAPRGVSVDREGNLFVTDTGNHILRKITPAGVVSTVAGTAGLSGSTDGAAAIARFNSPSGIVVDREGNLFVADTGNRTIRKGVPMFPPVFTTPPANTSGTLGAEVNVPAAVSGTPAPTFAWQRNGQSINGATSATLRLANLQPAAAGLYTSTATNPAGSAQSAPAIVGLSSRVKVTGGGVEFDRDVRHPNGNIFDQVLLNGSAAAVTADAELGQITRVSYIDLDDDIVQIEMSGPGTLSVVLETPTGPATPKLYVQNVSYMKGHAGIVITGADHRTNLTVFSVGKATAFDPTGRYDIGKPPSDTNDPANNGNPLFAGRPTSDYDGVADIAFIAIASTNGQFGGLRAANVNLFASRGFTGIYAPGVTFNRGVYVGDISAFDEATPVLVVGASADARVTGGDMGQPNQQAIIVAGISSLHFTAGTDSHGRSLQVRYNTGRFERDGVNVTWEIVIIDS